MIEEEKIKGYQRTGIYLQMYSTLEEIRSITKSASRYFADELYEDGYASLDHILALCNKHLAEEE